MRKVNLKDYVVALESGSRPKGGAVSNGIPSLGGEHINEYGGFNLEEEKLKYVSEEYFNNMKKGIIREGDILIVKDGATTGKCAYVDENFKFEKCCVNEHIFILRVNSDIIPKYLFYYLYSPIGQISILKDFRGATVGGISKNFINMQIYLPDLQIQHKIVQVLDKAQSLIDKRKEQIKQCDELIQSLFYEMFGSPVLNTKSFQKQELKNIAEIILGQSPSSRSYNTEGIGIPFFQGSAEFGDKYPTVVKWTTEPKKIAQKNDILISVRAPVGDVNIANIDCCIGRGLAAIRPSNKIIYRDYLFYYLKATSQIIFESKKAGSTFDSITGKNLGSTPILIPPLEQQKEFVAFYEKVGKQKDLLNQSLKLMEDNFNSLMQRAFRGELV